MCNFHLYKENLELIVVGNYIILHNDTTGRFKKGIKLAAENWKSLISGTDKNKCIIKNRRYPQLYALIK